jgi:hypothetical protein
VQAYSLYRLFCGRINNQQSMGIESAVLSNNDALVLARSQIEYEIFCVDSLAYRRNLPSVGERVATRNWVWSLAWKQAGNEDQDAKTDHHEQGSKGL